MTKLQDDIEQVVNDDSAKLHQARKNTRHLDQLEEGGY